VATRGSRPNRPAQSGKKGAAKKPAQPGRPAQGRSAQGASAQGGPKQVRPQQGRPAATPAEPTRGDATSAESAPIGAGPTSATASDGTRIAARAIGGATGTSRSDAAERDSEVAADRDETLAAATGAASPGSPARSARAKGKAAPRPDAEPTAAVRTKEAQQGARSGRPASPGRSSARATAAPASQRSAGRSGRPGGRAPGAPKVRPAGARDWIGGARLRTLPLAVAPVALGTGAAYLYDSSQGWHWARALLCLAVAVCLQIGVNFANDYSDGIRGTDAYRVGPARLTGSGAAKPRTVLTVAVVFFVLAGIAGVIVSVRSGYPWLIAVGAVAIAAGYFYTGGKRPYGYYGLGELFVFVFFGLVATVGTMFVQVDGVSIEAWLGAVSLGLLACAVLMVNNIRDAEQDRLAGKRTLAVLVGDRVSRILFAVFALAPFGILVFYVVFYEYAFYVYFALLAAVPAVIITITGRAAWEFVLALRLTSFTSLVFGVSLGAALAF